LAALESVSASAARAAGRTLGLSERTIYGLLRVWQTSGGLVTSLVPEHSSGGRGKGRLSVAAEQLVTEAIRDEYLSKQKKRAETVVRAVRDRCRTTRITPPAAKHGARSGAPGSCGQGGAFPRGQRQRCCPPAPTDPQRR
jgi:putative transposase